MCCRCDAGLDFSPQRLLNCRIMGTLVSALGVYLSLVIDLPTGATIVCTFGAVLLMAAARVLFFRKKESSEAAGIERDARVAAKVD
jgi:hypothetical protein